MSDPHNELETLQKQVTDHLAAVTQALQKASASLGGAAEQLAGAGNPSPGFVLDQAAAERDAIGAHIDSVDTKAGLVLGFSGVLVGLSATADHVDFSTTIFRAGLWFAVLAAGFAALTLALAAVLAIVPCCRYKPVNLRPATREDLVNDLVNLVTAARRIAKGKQICVYLAVVSLAQCRGVKVRRGLSRISAGVSRAGGIWH